MSDSSFRKKNMDPIETKNSIVDRYLSYLRTTFPIYDSEIKSLFDEQLNPELFVKGPLIEVSPPYKTGKSIHELIEEGILSKRFYDLEPNIEEEKKKLPIFRPLYSHQEKAIRTLTQGKNIIVTTGTGSGKTESFIIPILNQLFNELDNNSGEISDGVRAVFLYPMNALVNDQIQRLRCLLKDFDRISFGRYTGETPEKDFFGFNGDTTDECEELILVNERKTREEIRKRPPHLLFTNYAMLEYLLFRPKDTPLFEDNHWSFIVLDEVHTYNGAKGIEIAMLLRRLKDRVIKSDNQKTQCIGTSATLGSTEEELSGVVNFASKLFSEDFEKDSIILSDRIQFDNSSEWGAPTSEIYEDWLSHYNDYSFSNDQLMQYYIDSSSTYQIPGKIIENAKTSVDSNGKKEKLFHFLYEIFKGDSNVIHLRNALIDDNVKLLSDAASLIFPDNVNKEKVLSSLIDFVSHAKQPSSHIPPLIPAKYHFFVSSPEGAFLSLYPRKNLFLTPKKSISYDENGVLSESKTFEFGVCKKCGAIYLIGIKKDDRLELAELSENEITKSYFLFINPDNYSIDEDEDVNLFPKLCGFKFCSKCGILTPINSNKKICNCPQNATIVVYEAKSNDNIVHTCPVCNRTVSNGSIIHNFIFGRDALASVLITELYQKIPKNEKGMKKLLSFSDSRQDAAYFAVYLNRTYEQIQRRAAIKTCINDNLTSISQDQWNPRNLYDSLDEKVDLSQVFSPLSNFNLVDFKKRLKCWVCSELLNYSERLSLQGVGLLYFIPLKPNKISHTFLHDAPWNLEDEEVWNLFCIFIDTLRKNRAITSDFFNPADPFFKPMNYKGYYRESGSEKKGERRVFGWMPTKNTNKRLDFLSKIAFLLNINDKELINQTLKRIWTDTIRSLGFKEFFIQKPNEQNFGSVIVLNETKFEMVTPHTHHNNAWYICDKCHEITLYFVKGLCPTFRCSGELKPYNVEKEFIDDHYRKLYQTIDPFTRLSSYEHTAQYSPGKALEIQKEFKKGNIDILICSTTFELGVDLGELQSVFLKNVPPTPANYIQRAGRAGRRLSLTAYILTFCQLNPHDRAHYYEPERMVKGRVKPPKFDLENEKIILRHIYSTAIPLFLRNYINENHLQPDEFQTINDFFGSDEIITQFKDFIFSKPEVLEKSLKNILPQNSQHLLNIVNDVWVYSDYLFDEENGVLIKARAEYLDYINSLRALYFEIDKKIIAEKDSKERKKLINFQIYIERLCKTEKNRKLIEYLSNHNVIPKYGFPVDVVELKIQTEGGEDLRLQRDQKLAISEYAPGSQIVAGGKLWTSRYIKRIQNREWPQYYYAICSNCKTFIRKRYPEKVPTNCPECNTVFERKGIYITPIFGYINDRNDNLDEPDNRPERLYSSRAYYIGEEKKEKQTEIVSKKKNIIVQVTSGTNGWLSIINDAKKLKFWICPICGYGTKVETTQIPAIKHNLKHDNERGLPCNGTLSKYALGHEFQTDVLIFDFGSYTNRNEGFWESLLYALLEGISYSLDIERNDIDGCLYYKKENSQIIIYDDVPGGAGLVRRTIESQETLEDIFKKAYHRLSLCNCGGQEAQASCYGCLKNYRNQYCHNTLNRGLAMEFLNSKMSSSKKTHSDLYRLIFI